MQKWFFKLAAILKTLYLAFNLRNGVEDLK